MKWHNFGGRAVAALVLCAATAGMAFAQSTALPPEYDDPTPRSPLLADLLNLDDPLVSEGAQRDAATQDAAEAVLHDARFSTTCGVYCIAAAAKLHGLDADVDELLRPRFIGANEGSSLAELIEAADHVGLHAQPFANWTTVTLRHCSHHALLHVKARPGRKEYDHWVLFMGMRDGQVLVYDPPYSPRPVSLDALGAIWDGRGLVVDVEPPALGMLHAKAAAATLWPVLPTGAALWLCVAAWRRGRRQQPAPANRSTSVRARLRCSWASVSLIFGVAVATAVGVHALRPGGMLRQSRVVAAVQREHTATFLPKVTLAELLSYVNASRAGESAGNGGGAAHSHEPVLIVDAREPADYDSGHIPGAVNFPADELYVGVPPVVRAAPRDRRVIVYCQSRTCPYDERIARRLVGEGFTDVWLFPGGWNEWAEQEDTRLAMAQEDES